MFASVWWLGSEHLSVVNQSSCSPYRDSLPILHCILELHRWQHSLKLHTRVVNMIILGHLSPYDKIIWRFGGCIKLALDGKKNAWMALTAPEWNVYSFSETNASSIASLLSDTLLQEILNRVCRYFPVLRTCQINTSNWRWTLFWVLVGVDCYRKYLA